MTDRWIAWVRHHDVAAYEALGWVILDPRLICHHDVYACEMEWRGQGEPQKPMPKVPVQSSLARRP